MSLQAAETQWVYANTWLTWTLELDPHHNPTTGWTGIHHAWNTRLKQLTTWPHAPQALDETQAATLQALQAIDQPRHTHYAGPCPQCGKPLHATPGHHHATCANRHKIPTTQANQQAYEHAANQAWPITQTQQILALIGLNISAATIRTWQQRGKLGNWGRLPGGGRAYKPAEIAQHAQTLRHAPQSP
jgi:hypothetical protein